MFAQNATVYELEEYTKTRPKCSICRQLNTFSCEHRTPVRDSLIKIYNDEGRFYFEPKSTFISSKSSSSTTNTTNTNTTTAASTFIRQDLKNESNQTNKLSFRSESIADRSLRNKSIMSEKNNNNLKNIQVSNNLKSNNNNNNHKNNDLTKTESKPSGGCCLIM